MLPEERVLNYVNTFQCCTKKKLKKDHLFFHLSIIDKFKSVLTNLHDLFQVLLDEAPAGTEVEERVTKGRNRDDRDGRIDGLLSRCPSLPLRFSLAAYPTAHNLDFNG